MSRIAWAIVFLFVSSIAASACKCAASQLPSGTLRERAERLISRSDSTIFEGRVERIDVENWPPKPVPGEPVAMPSGLTVTFSDVRLFRGKPARKFVVVTGFGGGDCGYPFRRGESYLVFADAEPSGELSVGICGQTATLAESAVELRALRGEPTIPEDLRRIDSTSHEPEDLTPPPALCGKVKLPPDAKPEPFKIFLWMHGEEGLPFPRQTAESKDDGSFCVSDAEPAEYLIGAMLLDSSEKQAGYLGYYPGVNQRKDAVFFRFTGDPADRAEFALQRQPLFRVRGHLRGVPGALRDHMQVVLIGTALDLTYLPEPVEIGPHGEFEFSRLPAGRYTLWADDREDENLSCLSTVAEVDLGADVDDLSLEYRAKKR